jgi:hypothetical protein
MDCGTKETVERALMETLLEKTEAAKLSIKPGMTTSQRRFYQELNATVASNCVLLALQVRAILAA